MNFLLTDDADLHKSSPVWSPDGSRIAISRGRDPAEGSRIHIIDVAQTALTTSEDCSA